MLSKRLHAVPTSAVATDPEQPTGGPSQTLPASARAWNRETSSSNCCAETVQTESRGAQDRAASLDSLNLSNVLAVYPERFPANGPAFYPVLIGNGLLLLIHPSLFANVPAAHGAGQCILSA